MIQKAFLTVETDPLVGVILSMWDAFLISDSEKWFSLTFTSVSSDGMFSGGTGRAGKRGQSMDHNVALCFSGREQLGA